MSAVLITKGPSLSVFAQSHILWRNSSRINERNMSKDQNKAAVLSSCGSSCWTEVEEPQQSFLLKSLPSEILSFLSRTLRFYSATSLLSPSFYSTCGVRFSLRSPVLRKWKYTRLQNEVLEARKCNFSVLISNTANPPAEVSFVL